MQQHKYSLLLVLIILGVIYPFSLFIYIPKWDSINGYLPYRYFISDYLWNGRLPLWNPFQRFGYPGYADLQSGCWYPVVWIIMLFGKYDITSLMMELLFTFIVAGLGMYKLSTYIHQCKKTAFILGLTYGLSGFMIGSTQLMVFLIGVAWLPWCILALLKFFETFHFKYILASSIFVSLQVTGASPAYTIILAYIYIGIFIYFFWKNRHNLVSIKKGIWGGILLSVAMVLLLLPYIQSFIEFLPYFNRGDKLEYQGFLIQNPFVFVDYISFLFPYTVISKSEIFNLTDLTLRNAYIGIIGLLGFVFTLLQFKNRNNYFFPLLICVFISLILALGDEFFIYKYLYHLPGFGLFRHPSFFRGYAMFCMILLAGFSLKNAIDTEIFSRIEKSFFTGFGILIVILIFETYSKTSTEQIQSTFNEILNLIESSNTSFYSHFLINLIAIVIIFWITYLIKLATKLSLFQALVIFTVLDLGVQTRLSAPTTMYYKIPYKDVKTFFNNLPNNFNQKYNHEPFKNLNDTQGLLATNGVWKNLATFNKTISSVGENPLRFSSFDAGIENGVLDRNMENELLFFPTKEYSVNDTLQKGFIWATPSQIEIIEGSTSIKNVTIDYNSFFAEVENSANVSQWLVLNQNYHHLWKAFYNRQELPIKMVNEMVMGIEIPKKSHGRIHFSYSSPFLIYSALISIISYLSILLFWQFGFKRKPVVKEN
ncbi:MAG: YfhO family protein [Flavobacteriales bacterium]